MYQYGWMKEVRENRPGENGMRIITQVWKYGLGMTGNVPRLYPPTGDSDSRFGSGEHVG